jgi:hypothetical protein
VRIVSRTTRSMQERRREETQRRRAAAGTLQNAFPHVDQVRIELTFHATAGPVPAAQVHVLHPAAPASFEFACPHGDCDGNFDLEGATAALLKASQNQAAGSQNCRGTRAQGGMVRRPCSLRLDYRISALYRLKG